MRTSFGIDFERRSPNGRDSAAGSTLFASRRFISRSPATRLLRIEQAPSDHVQISKRGRGLESVQVLGEAPVTDFLEAKYPLDHSDRVFDLGPDTRLCAVRGLDPFVDSAAPSVAPVREVPRARRRRAHRILLPAV